jgi:hypothetical protein
MRSGVGAIGLLIAGAMNCGWADAQTSTAPNAPPAMAPVPGANSFSESQARQLIREQGFTEVSPLVNDSHGIWRGSAKKGTTKVRVSVDYQGHVNAGSE